MRLSFSVLWFDDSEVYFDSLDIESLKQEVFSWGFSLDIKMVSTPEEFKSYSPFKNFDLIVVDRILEDYPDGQEFIAELRNNAIYTEVIFYTAGNASDLWDAIREKQLEGVFVSSRNDILPKISKVGNQSIRKVLDLENMRGIVMAEVGELDHLLDEIITVGMVSLPDEDQKLIFKRFYDGITEQYQKTLARITECAKNPEVFEMLDMCDSDKRWQNFNRLRKSHDKLKGKDRIGDFTAEVLNPRNFLAHGRSELQKDGGYLFRFQGNEYRFDDEVSSNLRKTILKYKKAFSGILITLENG
jgi:hypothetical protein